MQSDYAVGTSTSGASRSGVTTCTAEPFVGMGFGDRFDGKEGVSGSSPEQGLPKVPANWHFVVVCSLNTRTHSGHICGTRDASRRLAAPSDTPPVQGNDGVDRRNPCKDPHDRCLCGRDSDPLSTERRSRAHPRIPDPPAELPSKRTAGTHGM